MKYIINHRIKGYTGKSACLVFSNGVSQTHDSWIASWFKCRGHNVIEINDDKTVTLEENSKNSTIENPNTVVDTPSHKNEEIDIYSSYSLEELKAIAKEKGVEGISKFNKADLIQALKTLEELENE